MKKILGSVFLILFSAITLFAGVKAYVNQSSIYQGDSVNFKISIDGKNPKFPDIKKIGSYNIIAVSSSQSVSIINGDYKSTTSKSYEFLPTKSMTIPSFKIKSSGKVYNTVPIDIKVIKPSASKEGDEVSISMSIDKSKVYVGEPIGLDVSVKYKMSANIRKIELSRLVLEDFWIKDASKPVQSTSGDNVTQTHHYLIFPQKSGDFKVKPIVANIGKVSRTNNGKKVGGNFLNDPFFNAFNSRIRWKKIFSNDLNISVKPLPNSLEVYGKFDINASVDKSEISPNQPLNLTIKIKGVGNVDDIKKFSINLPDVVEYSDNPKIKSSISNGKYAGEFTQKIALVADKDFIIPSLKFSYFDKDERAVVTKITKPIAIKVKGGSIASSQIPKIKTSLKKVKTSAKQTNESGYLKYLYSLLFFILIIGASFTLFKFYKKSKNKKEKTIIQEIKQARGDKELFDVLLSSQREDRYINEILEKLEENIYESKENQISKKEIIEHFLNI